MRPLASLLSQTLLHHSLLSTLEKITKQCVICQQTTPQGRLRPPPFQTHQAKEQAPGQDWQVDFTHVPPIQRLRCLLVFIDTFSGWTEAFPTSSEKTSQVTEKLLTQIIPRFGLLTSLQSDNGPAFISQITQQVSQALGIIWRFHTPYRPQSSGKVERMNGTLKTHLTQLIIQSHLT